MLDHLIDPDCNPELDHATDWLTGFTAALRAAHWQGECELELDESGDCPGTYGVRIAGQFVRAGGKLADVIGDAHYWQRRDWGPWHAHKPNVLRVAMYLDGQWGVPDELVNELADHPDRFDGAYLQWRADEYETEVLRKRRALEAEAIVATSAAAMRARVAAGENLSGAA